MQNHFWQLVKCYIPATVHPIKFVFAKEITRKFASFVRLFEDLPGQIARMTDLCRPPAIGTNLAPNDVPISKQGDHLWLRTRIFNINAILGRSKIYLTGINNIM